MIINDATLSAFRKDFMEMAAELEQKYNVTISLGGITYERERFTAKMTVNNGRNQEEIARANFDADVWKFEHLGFAKGMYHRVFTSLDGERFAIEGFIPNAKKYPLHVIRIADGKRMRAGQGIVGRIENEYYAGDCEIVEPDTEEM